MVALDQHIRNLIVTVNSSYPGAWLAWCDPRRDWLPLLQRAAETADTGRFTLLQVE